MTIYFDQHEMDNNFKLDLPKGKQQAHTYAPLTRSLATFSESPTTDIKGHTLPLWLWLYIPG